MKTAVLSPRALGIVLGLICFPVVSEETPAGQDSVPPEPVPRVAHLPSGAAEGLSPIQQRLLRTIARKHANLPAPPSYCFAPGTSAEKIEDFTASSGSTLSYFRLDTAPSHWTKTATDDNVSRGDPITLTWGIVPDDTLIPQFDPGSGPAAGSNLRAYLNGKYGNEATWMPLFQQVFDRWSELTGITYLHEPMDDEADFSNVASVAPGVLGVRPDIRIGGRPIDGNNGILGFNFGPPNGEMVLDTMDTAFDNMEGGSQLLRNVISHEHGHGLGLLHVCPDDDTKLMEPISSTNLDGPQHDDILAAQRQHGDPREPNDASGEAVSLGTLTDATVTATQSVEAILSIDGGDDVDFFSFSAGEAGKKATILLRPVGQEYLEGAQNQDGTCQAGTLFDTRENLNLAVELIDTDGTTVLATADATLAGEGETIMDVELSSTGPYFIRVTGGGADNVQMYDFDLIVSDGVAGEIASLAFGAIPTPQSVGSQFAVELDALDVFGEAAVNFTGTANLSVLARETVLITEIRSKLNEEAIEFQNVAERPVDVSGWQIVIYDRESWPNPVGFTVTIPANSVVSPGGVFTLVDQQAIGALPSLGAGSQNSIVWQDSPDSIGEKVGVLLLDEQGMIMDFATAGDSTEISLPMTIPADQWSGPGMTISKDDTFRRMGSADTQGAGDWTTGSSGIGLPNGSLTTPFPNRNIAFTPSTTGTFSGGSRTENVTFNEPANRIVLKADDGNGHVAYSPTFDAILADDLEVELAASPLSARTGETITLTATLHKIGPNSANSVELSYTLPANTEYVTGSASQGSIMNVEGTVTASLGTLAADATATVNIQITASEIGPLQNTVTLTRGELDPFAGNNSASVQVNIVAGPDSVEEFNAFMDIAGESPADSPNDTGGTFQHVDFSPAGTTTALGFAVDTAESQNGRGLVFESEEMDGIRNSEDISPADYTDADGRHMLAFWFRFTDNSVGDNNISGSLITALNQGSTVLGQYAYNFRVGVGPSGTQGVGLVFPSAGVGDTISLFVPVSTDQWHRCVVHYDSPSTVDAEDGALSIWIDPQNGADTPDITQSSLDAAVVGPFGRYGFGAMPFASNAGGPKMFIDSIATWDGFGTPGVNDLQSAIDFLNSALPSLSIAAADAAKAEGDSGTTAFDFTVTRNGPGDLTTTVDFAVMGSGPAAADPDDFGGTFPSGTITFNPGEISKNLSIDVTGDTGFEADETFQVVLSNGSNGALISVASATGTIQNDDVEDMEFGDAPLPFPTTLANDGARHGLSGPTLGAERDGEPDGQPDPTATGDDTNGSPDDEDGVVFATMLIPGESAVVEVNVQGAPSGAKLNAWIDFNGNGSWADPDEQIFNDVDVNNGDNMLMFAVPPGSNPGNTFARFRLDFSGGLSFTGPASDGEVEDYGVAILGLDFGDAPDIGAGTGVGDYETTFANDGPRHVVIGSLRLGVNIDAEGDGLQSIGADADDMTGTPDDEDGVTFDTPLVQGLDGSITVEVTGGPGLLDVWFDWNANGFFGDPGEVIVAGAEFQTDMHSVTVAVPADAAPGTTFARFRIHDPGGLQPLGLSTSLPPTGLAPNGEVEDHAVSVQLNAAPSATDATVEINENLANDEPVHIVLATDPDSEGGDTLAYAITSGNSSGAFAIDGATGEITVNDTTRLDFETTPQFMLTVTVTDRANNTDEATITINLNNLNEAPTAVANDNSNTGIKRNESQMLPAVKDATIFESGGVNGIGSLFAGVTLSTEEARRALIQFDLAAIPPSSIISGASLTLTIDKAKGADDVYNVHRLLASWIEGDQDGSGPGGGQGSPPAGNNDVTWTEAMPGAPWATPGGDFDPIPSSDPFPLPAASGPALFPGEGMLADVQAWYDDPSMNFGWILKHHDEGTAGQTRRFLSREDGPGGPVLTVNYDETTSLGGGLAVEENGSLDTPNVLFNDTDPEGDTLTIVSADATSVEGGTVTDHGNGTFTYSPPASFDSLPEGGSGTDSFNYVATDGEFTSIGTVTITVTGVNDPPVAVAPGDQTVVVGETVNLSAPEPMDPDMGDTFTFEWDFDFGGGAQPQGLEAQFDVDATGRDVSTSYMSAGARTVGLRVTDNHEGVSEVATLTVTVNKAGTTLVLASNPNPSDLGQAVTLTATVTVDSPGAGAPTGDVDFFRAGEELLGSASLDPTGVVTLMVSDLEDGMHSLHANYAGDANFNPATSSAVTQTVEAGTLTVNVAAESISENGGDTTLMVTRDDTSGTLTVNLMSSDESEATLPASVEIADGQSTSPPVTITAVDDALLDGTQTVTITASADGFLPGMDTVDVTDDEFAATELLINEVLFTVLGGDSPNEYVELRGTPNGIIPEPTYFAAIDGKSGSNPGDIKTLFDLSGLRIGANGFLVFLQNGHPYVPDEGASVHVSSDSGFSGLEFFSADLSIEIANDSITFALIDGSGLTTTTDLDTDNDGIFEEGPQQVLDSVSVVNTTVGDVGYGAINFVNGEDNTTPEGEVRVSTPGATPQYVGRIGDSIGSAAEDWVGAQIGGDPGSFFLEVGKTFPNTMATRTLDHVGSANPLPDTATEAPAFAMPAGGSRHRMLPIEFVLPEAPLSGSIKLEFNLALTPDGLADPPEATLVLADVQAGQTVSFLWDTTTDPADLAEVDSADVTSLPDGAYDITLSYRDVVGNAAATVTRSGVNVDTVTRAPSLIAPVADDTFGGTLTVTFNLPETPQADSVILTLVSDSNENDRTLVLASSAQVAGESTVTLDVGEPMSADGVQSVSPVNDIPVDTYTVTVSYQDDLGNPSATASAANVRRLSNDATLSGLAVSDTTLSPAFLPATTSYTATVDHTVAGVTVTPTAADANASIQVEGQAVASGQASSSISLPVGETAITIAVAAEDGLATATYTVVVTREAPPVGMEPVLHWKLDETSGTTTREEISGEEDVATLSGAVNRVPGIAPDGGNAASMQIDNPPSFIDAGTLTSAGPYLPGAAADSRRLTGNWTVTAWIDLAEPQAIGDRTLISSDITESDWWLFLLENQEAETGTPNQLAFDLNSTRIRSGIEVPTAKAVFVALMADESATAFMPGNRHRFAVWDGESWQFGEGEQFDEIRLLGLEIGSFNSGERQFEGGIDDVRIYGRTLAQEDLEAAINRLPVAELDEFFGDRNVSLEIGAAELTANDTDPDGGALTVTAVDASSGQGGSVSLAGTVISYVPPTDFVGTDSFDYTVADELGGTAVATVLVQVSGLPGVRLKHLAMPDLSSGQGDVEVKFAGLPDQTYRIEVSEDLANWSLLEEITTGADGVIQFLDENGALLSRRFYRVVKVEL